MKNNGRQQQIKIEEKVFSYIESHGMIVPGDKIVIGVSGGADSVCLLFLLLEYGRRVPVRLGVVHVNHCLRADAGEDARYVEDLCREQKVPFYLTEADVRELAAREKCSEEDAGRRVRYRAFYQAAERMGGAKLAVAHNMGDNAETMLFHLFRGSGLKGLCGIAPVRGEIIRPILCLERQEVEAYLREREISWRTDSTNGEDHYRRNRIRHHIMPYVESQIVQGAAGHMCRTAELLSETEDYLQRQTQEALRQCVSSAGRQAGPQQGVHALEPQGAGPQQGRASAQERYVVDVSRFMEFHISLRRRMLCVLAERLSPTGKDISAVHTASLLSLFEEPGNRDISLPFGIVAKRRYREVILERGGRMESAEGAGWEVALPAMEPGQTVTVETGGGEKLEFSLFFPTKVQEVPRNQCTKWLDYDKIIESPVIRFRRTGDFLTIAGRDGELVHKTLKAYMIAEKIPKELRERIPVIACGSHILWLAGYRISEYFKIHENTNRVLQVKLEKGCKTEEEDVRTH